MKLNNKTKKVHFNTNNEIQVMHVWNYAYRAARKGHWQQYACDRSRFQRRIENVGIIISRILTSDHRKIVKAFLVK